MKFFMSRLFTKFILPIIVLAIGIFMLILGGKGIGKQKSYPSTTATISEIRFEDRVGDDGQDAYVTVTYQIDGKEYSALLDEYRSSYKIGTEVEIIYSPEDPTDIAVKGYFGTIMEIVFGIVLIILAPILFLKL